MIEEWLGSVGDSKRVRPNQKQAPGFKFPVPGGWAPPAPFNRNQWRLRPRCAAEKNTGRRGVDLRKRVKTARAAAAGSTDEADEAGEVDERPGIFLKNA